MKLIKSEDEQGTMYSLSGDNLPDNYVLSKQNCDELFGVVDVDKLAELEAEKRHNWDDHDDTDIYNDLIREDAELIKIGFNKAMELNKNKVFTLEDIRRAYYVGYEDGKSGATFFQQLIQSLQQPTEIEVIIEMELNMNGKNAIDRSMYIPKLDSEGCLILKRI
jgi:hypothetical protein